MSGPMTSGEIEDVLSSIRKLVSDDLRPQPRPPVAAPPQDTGKLILTPALRVADEAAAGTWSAAEAARRLRLDAVVSTVAAQVSPPAGGWEAETGDAALTHLVRPPVAAPVPEPFPDVAAEDDTPAVPAAGADAPKPLHFAWQSRRAGQEAAEADPPAAAPAGAADLEVATPEGGPLADRPEGGALADLDIEAIADLVRDVLREELQGALGERMTRNIRKLVRAEVARMIATRDLA